MEMFSQLFKKELIFTDLNCDDKETCFEEVFAHLQTQGYVKDSFETALKKREGIFPTGLDTNPFQVAIPHTDPEHVITPFIAVVKPKNPLKFIEMGTDDKEIDAHIVLILGLTKAEGQTSLLQNLIELFMDKKLMEQLLAHNDQESLYLLLKSYMNSKGGVYL